MRQIERDFGFGCAGPITPPPSLIMGHHPVEHGSATAQRCREGAFEAPFFLHA
jgi:hypothetical protein